MHDLGLGDIDAALTRYDMDLAPRVLQGTRSLVDAGSLLWRLHLLDRDERITDVSRIEEVVGKELDEPTTAFTAMHSVLVYAAAGDVDSVKRLAAKCQAHESQAVVNVVAPLAHAMAAYVNADFDSAADGLVILLPRSVEIGASRVQCEVIEDTALAALIHAGRLVEAQALLSIRLDRREHAGDRQLQDRLVCG
jgi:hypothetical protein